MISGSRTTASGGSRRRTKSRKSTRSPERIQAGDAMERRQQLVPVRPLRREHLAAFGREPIIAAPALTCLLDPLAVDPPAAFHPIEHRIERRHVKPEDAARSIV